MEVVLIICFILSLIDTGCSSERWDVNYDIQEKWPGVCKSGLLQSPIPLYEGNAIKRDFTPLLFEGFHQESVGVVKNNGHTVEVRMHDIKPPTVSGGGLPEHYTLDHFHFHWQSEHTIEDAKFALECHFVFYATPYRTIGEAIKHPNGIAVFAVLYDLSPDDDEEIQPMLDILDSIHGERNVEKAISQFRIKDFLPRDTAGFFRYNGSLTTPDCFEVVVWTIFTETIPISRDQIAKFYHMKNFQNEIMLFNSRMMQPVNGRNVYLKQSPVHGTSRAAEHSSSPLLLALSSLLIHIFQRI